MAAQVRIPSCVRSVAWSMLPPGAMAKVAARVPRHLVVVRAGERELFEDLRQLLARVPYPTVLIRDRRRRDRRVVLRDVPEDRRGRDRRAPPSPTWEPDGFLVAETDRLPAGAIENWLAATPIGNRLDTGLREATASRQSIRRAWDRAERLFALRRLALDLRIGLGELRRQRATVTAEAAGHPTVILA